MYLGLYAPTYEYKAANKDKSVAKVDKIENGNLSYAEALDNVAFTGDSQIAALISYNILEQSNVEALVGASADYMEENSDLSLQRQQERMPLLYIMVLILCQHRQKNVKGELASIQSF